jgi:hypothetical protein
VLRASAILFFMKSNYIPVSVPFKGIIINVVHFGDFFSPDIIARRT